MKLLKLSLPIILAAWPVFVSGQQVIAPSEWTVQELEIACNANPADSEPDQVAHTALLLGACRGYIEGVADVMMRNCLALQASDETVGEQIPNRHRLAASGHWHFLHGVMSLGEWVKNHPEEASKPAFEGVRKALEGD